MEGLDIITGDPNGTRTRVTGVRGQFKGYST